MDLRNWFVFGSLLATVACTGDIYETPGPAPTLLAVSRPSVSVGQSLEFVGLDFATGLDGYTKIRFEGTFVTSKGEQVPVDYEVRPHWIADTRLLWDNVGPFKNPFEPTGTETGEFEGTVTAINVNEREQESPGDPMPYSMVVNPSIVVTDLQPAGMNSECEQPARRLIGGFPYRIEVQVIGDFQAESITYELFGESGVERQRIFRVPAEGNRASLGDDGELWLAPVGDKEVFYIADLLISARDAKGNTISTVFGFGVHRPFEYIDWGKPTVAQREQPMPVSGCIAGGINGQHVEYSEMNADTESRQTSFHLDETWVEEHSSQYSTSHEERNGINMSVTNTHEYALETNWNQSTTSGSSWNVGANLFGVFNGGYQSENSTTGSRGGSERNSWSTARTVGSDYSVADTESWAFTNSNSYSVAKGTGSFHEISSTDTISRSQSADILPSFFGVWYRQKTRIVRPGSVVVYNMCGQPELVGDAYFPDFVWAASLAQGPSCEDIKPTLPPAECLMAPCSGN